MRRGWPGVGTLACGCGGLERIGSAGCIGVPFRFALSGCWVGFVFEIARIAAVGCEVSGPVDIDDFEIHSDSPMTSLIDNNADGPDGTQDRFIVAFVLPC
jgi:hypothetical protein